MAQTLYQFKADLQGLTDLEKKLKIARLELKKLTADTNAYKAKTAQIGTLGKQFDSLTNSMGKAQKAAGQMNNSGKNLINTFKSAAIAIGAAFAVRFVVGGIKAAISQFVEFEGRMAEVKAITQATEKEFKKLEGSAIALGQSTIFTAQEVGSLQAAYSKLGFSVDQILLMQKHTLDLASATGETLAGSAEVAGATLNAFTYEAIQTQRVTDVMAQSFLSTALNLERFRESMKYAAPIARTVGFTLEETTAILGKMADAGIHGSIAGNALKNIMLSLGDANSKLAKRLGGPVVGTEQLAVALKKLSAEGFSASEAVALLDKRAAPAFLALIRNVDGLEELTAQLNAAQGATAQMAAIRLNSLQGDVTLMKSAMEGLSISIGQEFNVSMRNSVHNFTKFIQNISKSDSAMKTFRYTVNLLILAFSGLAARMIALGIGKFVMGIWAGVKAVGSLASRLFTATKAQESFNIAASKNVYLFLAQAITTAIVAYSMMGEEMNEAALEAEKLNDELQSQIGLFKILGKRSRAYYEGAKAFGDSAPKIAEIIDLTLLSPEHFEEINATIELLKDTSTKIASLNQKNAEIATQIGADKLRLKESLKTEGPREEEKRAGRVKYRGYTALGKEESDLEMRIRRNEETLKVNEKAEKDAEAHWLKMMKQTTAYTEFNIVNGKSMLKILDGNNDEQLEIFRRMSYNRQQTFLEQQQNYEDDLEFASIYFDLQEKAQQASGESKEDYLKEINIMYGKGNEQQKLLVSDMTQNVGKINTALDAQVRFVSNLQSIAIKNTQDHGAKLAKTPLMDGAFLNETKDHYKDLRKLVGELVQTEFLTLIEAVEESYDIKREGYNRELELMKTNQTKIREVEETQNIEFISQTIKANKNKFTVLKNLTHAEYEALTDINKGNLADRLAMLDLMHEEETNKIETTNAAILEMEKNMSYELQAIELKRKQEMQALEKTSQDWKVEESLRNQLELFKKQNELNKLQQKYDKELIKDIEKDKDIRLAMAKSYFEGREKFLDEAKVKLNTDRAKEIEDAKDDAEKINAINTKYDDLDAKNLLDANNNYQHYADAKVIIAQEAANEISRIQDEGTRRDNAIRAGQIQQVQETYTEIYGIVTGFLNQRYEAEMAQISESLDQTQSDLDTKMDYELEQAEGNETAQEGIRKKYELRKEEADIIAAKKITEIKKKQFMIDKANSIAQALMNGAIAATRAAADVGFWGMWAAVPLVTGLMLAQIALIGSQKFTGAKGGIVPGLKTEGSLDRENSFADGGLVHGPSHKNGGVKFNSGGRVIELEGGEAVINKRSTAMFGPQLSAMNVAGGGKKFEHGGVTPGTSNALNEISNSNTAVFMQKLEAGLVRGYNSKKVFVTETDVTRTQHSVSVTEANANLFL